MNFNYNPFKFGRLAFLATAVAFSLNSCDTDTDEPVVQEDPAPPTPQIGDGHGTLVAAQTITYFTQDVPGFGTIEEEIPIGVAVGVFFDGTDYETFVPVGSVTCEGESLEKQDNNSYALTVSQLNAEGITFEGRPDWVVGGDNGIPSFEYTTINAFPEVGKITSPNTLTRSAGYTVTFEENISGADSVLWVIGGELLRTTGGSAGQVNAGREFDADALSGLQAGTSIIQVAAYNYETVVEGGKMFYFINETVVTQTVTVE